MSRGKVLRCLKTGLIETGVYPPATHYKRGVKRMDFRKVIQIRGTSYISIPVEICKALEIRAGERLKVSYVTGTGIFITQLQGADKIPIEPKSIDGLKKSTDFIYSQLEKKLKNLESTSISNYHTAMIKEISRLGIFELKMKVDRLEKRAIEVNKVKGKLVLIRQRKKSSG